jgi:hypothetical protein
MFSLMLAANTVTQIGCCVDDGLQISYTHNMQRLNCMLSYKLWSND